MDLGGWLRSLGLEQYEATFRENAINEKVLPNLTAEDLKDMGVSIVGHRRMLLDAIALLRADESAKANGSYPRALFRRHLICPRDPARSILGYSVLWSGFPRSCSRLSWR
jgi:hypothetical protein